MNIKPYKATVRSYQVGFGDCILLSFHYRKKGGDEEARHILIDCGSSAAPLAYERAKKKFSLVPVAEDIKKQCGGKLCAIIATHRHSDHISGFCTDEKTGRGPGDILRSLKPKLVLQPWTEDPALSTDATGPKTLRASSRKFALGLQGMQRFSEGMIAELSSLEPTLGKNLVKQLRFLGEDNIANRSAVENLMTMTANEYLYYGKKTGLEKLLPGVKIKVLGPPTLEQSASIRKQRGEDAAEFWQLRGAAQSEHVAGAVSPFKKSYWATKRKYPYEIRWIIPRIQASRGAELMELVRVLDEQMNNTSLILLFQFGGKNLLFPGDAQIESWEYALKEAGDANANQAVLAQTDFYKVGHHGSRNATPKTLWNLFAKKGVGAGSLQTMLSTRVGKHGSPSKNTEVPRATLLKELSENSRLFDTETLGGTSTASFVMTTVEE